MTDIAPHGLHHVTAIATDPQRNVDFYTGVLGLRLVKTTVNFDDPETYHLYYGDEAGRPSTILTFFPWRDVPRDPTASMLTGLLGMRAEGGEDRVRFEMGREPGAVLDVTPTADPQEGLQAGGTVHHVAFRAPDGETQERWRTQLVDAGLEVTPVLDRRYFTSIYFREPGGVLFEIATDRPGFDVDEPLLELGRHLRLPPWLEPTREQIERALPPLRLGDDLVEGTA
ncbi:MAG TPA: VOC family protein [Actinomycetospora sp.]|jgi:catechol 2,3-dioxygenase-like lactoylglutathione lyase family enzyme|uniref:VOC family protein n=1 Tax=Actinomycetospora sp. TaxID=1872135 RepID=UPI002F4255CA